MLKFSLMGSAYRGGSTAFCSLITCMAITVAFLVCVFAITARHNPNLVNFQSAIIDRIGIRWIVAIVVLGGSTITILVISLFIMRSSRAYGKSRGHTDDVPMEALRQQQREENLHKYELRVGDVRRKQNRDAALYDDKQEKKADKLVEKAEKREEKANAKREKDNGKKQQKAREKSEKAEAEDRKRR
jgi:hypothetical protein